MEIVKVYTDGACSDNPGPGGWASVFTLEEDFQVLTGREYETTNNRMELLAVIETLREILVLNAVNVDEVKFLIHSDSAYVVNSINNRWIDKWQMNGWMTTQGEDIKNKDLWMQFVDERKAIRKRGIEVEMVKVKGHAGDIFNEMADKHAREQSMMAKEEWSEWQ